MLHGLDWTGQVDVDSLLDLGFDFSSDLFDTDKTSVNTEPATGILQNMYAVVV